MSQFITNHPQAVCLEDMHQPQPKYDYSGDGVSPGEKYNALAQCQLSFGNEFKPHLKYEVPFEVRFFYVKIIVYFVIVNVRGDPGWALIPV